MKFNLLSTPLAAMLCASLLFSCTTDIEPPPPPLPQEPSSSSADYSSSSLGSSSSQVEQSNSSSSNGGTEPEYGYCVYPEIQQCYPGPFSACPGIGGTLSNTCPYSSSSSAAVSSPSVASSSSSKPFSSSSGSVCISSGSYCNYGGCSVWSSDGWSCSLHINGWANEGGCYPMPTDDNCDSGTLVSVCPANAVPPASNYCRLPSSSSTMASSSSIVLPPPSSSSIFIVPSSSSSFGGTSGTFTDARDSKIYRWVKIGTQVWMAENLNYNAEGSRCYDDYPANCTTYGRLYNLATAMTVCPSGWHLPRDAEWDALMTAVGGSSTAGTKLKATSGWNDSGSGTDAYGFAALPGGYGLGFDRVGNDGYWWSATENGALHAYVRGMIYLSEGVGRFNDPEYYLHSVRCLQD